ncbi:hypothetical protein F4860DRAFT_191459 [Xylaria cubensis]|nr:hypothetical protein F4860DRAFT_191459 [Xylaria cubensis]
MSEPFQLVLIDGITDKDGPLDGTNDTMSFFSSSFPTVDIVQRQFPDTSPGQPLTSTDLHRQALLIGRELIGESTLDDNGSECSSQSKDAPLIFIGHDTGGCLIKQILLLAREEKMFQSILVRVKGVIFVGTPHKGPDLTIWEHHIICLLGSSSPLPFPSQYLQGLPRQLLDNSEAFAQISWNFEILNVIQARPRLRDFVNLRPRSIVTLHEAFTLLDSPKVKNLRLRCSHAALWQFETGSSMSDTVCKEISGMLGSERSAAQDGFQNFIHRLNQLHPVECGVGTTRPAANSLEWVDRDETYKLWKSKDYKGLLHVSGPPGSGTTVLATNLLRSVLEAHKYRQITMLSFGFNRNDIRARSQESALLSLNRQVLLAHPDLFLFVEPLCSFMLERDLFNKGVLWSLLRSLLTHLAETKLLWHREPLLILSQQAMTVLHDNTWRSTIHT